MSTHLRVHDRVRLRHYRVMTGKVVAIGVTMMIVKLDLCPLWWLYLRNLRLFLRNYVGATGKYGVGRLIWASMEELELEWPDVVLKA